MRQLTIAAFRTQDSDTARRPGFTILRRLRMKYIFICLLILGLIPGLGYSQDPSRVGTTAANFLELGYGPAASSMGDAYVSLAEDLSAVYWNPAGLAFLERNEVMGVYQPWLVDINTSFAAVGLNLNSLGTLAFSVINVDYGDMEVTTVENQSGTGELFSSRDLALSVSYSRAITEWFAFGASAKYISSTFGT